MKRQFKHGMSLAVAILSALFVNTACTEEWDDHYDNNGTNTGKGTMLEYVKGQSDLSDFCAVVEALGCADSLFNQSRAYTLWAPVNESFNKEEMMDSINNGRRDWVMQRFVKSHIANYLNPASEAMDDENFVLLLNEKMVIFSGDFESGYKFDGKEVKEANQRVSNGIVHKVDGAVEYALNLWEYLAATKDGVDSVAKFLYSFNITEFDEYASVKAPNGRTYIDSVFKNSNVWFEKFGDKYSAGIGDVTAEDSTYMMFVPTNTVWNEWVPQIEKLFNFYYNSDDEAAKFEKDSLRWLYARKSLLKNMLFSVKDQPAIISDNNGILDEDGDGERDSLYSTFNPYDISANKRRLIARADLMNGSTEGVECSNGTFYIKNNFNFSPYYIWQDTIKVEAEITDYQGAQFAGSKDKFETSCNAYTRFVSKIAVHDSIPAEDCKDRTYVEGIGTSTKANPELVWTIPEVLSGSYYIGAVMIPPHYASKRALVEESLPNKINIEVKANNGKGTAEQLVKNESKNFIYNDPTRVDTIWLSDKDGNRVKVKFPYSEYGIDLTKTTVTVRVASAVDRKDVDEDKKEIYNRTLRIDNVILEPVEDDVEE